MRPARCPGSGPHTRPSRVRVGSEEGRATAAGKGARGFGLELAAETTSAAQVKIAIEDTLDEGLPRAYTPDLYKTKCAVLFEHVFETFGEPATV
jgi:hypothetical protein